MRQELKKCFNVTSLRSDSFKAVRWLCSHLIFANKDAVWCNTFLYEWPHFLAQTLSSFPEYLTRWFENARTDRNPHLIKKKMSELLAQYYFWRLSQNQLEKSNELSCIYHKLKKIFYRGINDVYMDVQFAIPFSILIKQIF